MDSMIYLAVRYVLFHRTKSVILVLCITLSLFLPLAGKTVLDRVEHSLRERALATPFVIGARGSQFDLTLHALYLDVPPPEKTSYAAFRFCRQDQPGWLIPLYRSHFVRNDGPVVGTDTGYFEFRELELDEGTLFQRIGQCVVGAELARRLEVGVGDKLISRPENDVNLAGATPVRMQVCGVLKRSGTSDDLCVFTDIKTTWIIDGLGHGHQDLKNEKDENLFIDRDQHMATANQGVLPYIEITDENVASVHFHGDADEFPLTAILLIPDDDKSATMLQSRIQNDDSQMLQMVQPSAVIDQLMEKIVRVKSLFDITSLAIALITVLFLVLNTLLSIRLRQREMLTLFRIGCSRGTVLGLFAWEYALIILFSLVLALGLIQGTVGWLEAWVLSAIR